SIEFREAAPPIAWSCVAQAVCTCGVKAGVPPGMLGFPLASSTGSGIDGIPCRRAQAMAARQAAKLPGEAVCCVPPPTLGTVAVLLDDPHAASAIADTTDSGIRRAEGFMRFLSALVYPAEFYDPGGDSPVIGEVTEL